MADKRVALVTGSGKRRIGSHVATALAKRGYSVAVHYFRSDAAAHELVAELRQHGVAAESFQADLRDEHAVEELAAQVVAQFGRIDVLVNCAAIWHQKPLEVVSAADLREFFESNTLSTFMITQRVGLLMTQQPEGGSIILMGDWAVARPYTGYAAYFASKGSIPTLTRCFAVEFGTRNSRVRVNGILPGPAMLPEGFPDEERERVVNSTLVKREGSPDHVAQAVLHFVENDFLTGTCLPVDGGRTIFANDEEAR